jgi:hypothetical protein
MKTLITALFFVLSFTCIAQDDSTYVAALPDPRLQRFEAPIIIDLPAKFGFTRKAEFRGFFYNLDNLTLSLRWRVRYYSDTVQVRLFGLNFEDKEQIAAMGTFVDMTGTIIDTTGHPGPFWHEIEFYKMVAEQGAGGATINDLIRAAGMRPGRWKD